MGKRIALAGVGGAVSLIFIVLSYFISVGTVALNALAACGVLLPLLKGYYREAALTSIAVILLGTFFVTINIIPFAVVGSLYTILTVWLCEKNVKLYFSIPIKVAYALLSFYIIYSLASLITVNPETIAKMFGALTEVKLYIILNAAYLVGFLVYDYALLMIYRYLKFRFSRL